MTFPKCIPWHSPNRLVFTKYPVRDLLVPCVFVVTEKQAIRFLYSENCDNLTTAEALQIDYIPKPEASDWNSDDWLNVNIPPERVFV